MKNNSLKLEKKYHDSIAKDFFLQRKQDFLWEIPERLFLLKKEYLQNRSIIEMGCGPSLVISKVVNNKKLKIKSYLGIDISKNMISLAKENFPDGKYIIGDMIRTNLPNSIADTLISLGALHHVENKYKTLSNWIRLLKRNGYLLLREPTQEALKKGTGASPIEEGIEVLKVNNYLNSSGVKVLRNLYFSSHLFHLINRLFIKILGSLWIKKDFLWYPVMIFDVFISSTLGGIIPLFRGEACIIIAQKL